MHITIVICLFIDVKLLLNNLYCVKHYVNKCEGKKTGKSK